MRVVHLCRVAPPGIGGMEAMIAGLANAQSRAGWAVRVVTLQEDPPRGGGAALDPSVGRVALRRVGPARYGLARGLARALDGAEVVHVHGLDGLADQALSVRGRPWVVGVSTHGGYLHTPRDRLLKQVWLRTITRASLARAEAIWFTSESDRVRLAPGLPRGEVVPNGLVLDDLLSVPRAPDPSRLLVFGRVDAHKGLERLLDVLGVLSRRDPRPFTLDVVGAEAAPGLVELLRAHAARRGIGERVVVHGAVSREALTAVFARAALALFPSRAEGFGLALVEAMAAGVPVVAQPLPAFAQKLEDGRSGFLVDFDDTEGAAARLASLRATLGAWTVAASREAARRWEWSAVLPRWQAAYDAVRGGP